MSEDTRYGKLSDNITAARHLLWVGGYDEGFQPGGFEQQLIETFLRADMHNTERLLQGFPHYRIPLEMMRNQGGNVLNDWVKGQSS